MPNFAKGKFSTKPTVINLTKTFETFEEAYTTVIKNIPELNTVLVFNSSSIPYLNTASPISRVNIGIKKLSVVESKSNIPYSEVVRILV